MASVRLSDLGVPRVLTTALERQGITDAFPIQAATLPDAIAGRDVCGKAPTGSGKTLAFGLAVLSRLEARPAPRHESGPAAGRRGGRRRPSALVLVPTRELAAQIVDVVAPLASLVGARVAAVYGGVGYGKQEGALRQGVDVLVACPGRLTDLVQRRSADLSRVDIVVVDEADRMADMGFLPAVRRLVDLTSSKRQTLLFSATLDGPVDTLVRSYQRDPVRHVVEAADTDQGDVSHHFWRVEHNDRVAVTARTISSHGPAVVFCRTKRGADRLSERLGRSGLHSAAIHGDRSQAQRERALAAFRAGRLDVLVATDVAARGIHVDAVPLVVHYDPAADHTDYVHRSGRTGRAGADGMVVSLVGREQLETTRRMQRTLGLTGGISAPTAASAAAAGPADGKPRLRPVPASDDSSGASSDTRRPRRPASSGGQRSSARPSRRRAPRGARRSA